MMIVTLLLQSSQCAQINTFATEKSIKLKSCVTAQVGFEYILSAFEKMFDQYMQRFNREFEEEHGSDHPQKKSTFAENVFAGNLHLKVMRDKAAGGAFVNKTASIADQLLVVGIPYMLEPIERVWDIHLKKEVPEVILKGTIEINLHLEWTEATTVIQGAQSVQGRVPHLRMSVNKRHGIKMDRACKYHPRYCQIVSELHGFVSRFITYNDERFFDHVSSARTLKGLMYNFNAQVSRHAFSNFASLDLGTENLNLAWGCTQAQVDDVLAHPVGRH